MTDKLIFSKEWFMLEKYHFKIMDIARYRLRIARKDLDTANLTFASEQCRAANNRAYYSIFHSIRAVLAKEGIAFKRHKDTIGYFNKNYIHIGVFPKELGRKYHYCLLRSPQLCLWLNEFSVFTFSLVTLK